MLYIFKVWELLLCERKTWFLQRFLCAAAAELRPFSAGAAESRRSISSLQPPGRPADLTHLLFIHPDIFRKRFTALLNLFLYISHFLLDVTHQILQDLLRLTRRLRLNKRQKLQEVWISYLHVAHDLPKCTFCLGQERTGAAWCCCAAGLDLGKRLLMRGRSPVRCRRADVTAVFKGFFFPLRMGLGLYWCWEQPPWHAGPERAYLCFWRFKLRADEFKFDSGGNGCL